MHATSPTRSFRFGLFEADAFNKALTRNGVRVKIQDQPFRVLLLLIERPGEIVSREELRSALWPDGTFVDFDGSLNVILKKLRAVLDDNSDNPRFIETVPRHGYRFIAPVTVRREEPPPLPVAVQIIPPAIEVRTVPAGTAALPKIRPALIYSVLCLVLLLTGIAGWMRWSSVKSTAIASSASPTSQVRVRRSVAVLGFQNLSGSPADTWMGTAISEMLSTEMAGGDELRLVTAEDVANLRAYSPWAKTDTLNKETTLRIGNALGTDLIVLGSYTTIGKPGYGRLRVDVRLQNCRSGEVIGEIAEIGATADLFGVVSRIGEKLRNRLGVPRTVDADEVMVQASLPASPDAARFYSLGLEKLRDADFPAARGLFEQAIAAEPKFPLAHAMLSRTDLSLGHFDQAKVEARRGLDLSAGLPRVQRMQIEASYDQAIGDRGKAADIYRVLFDLFPDSLDYGLQLAKLQLDAYRPEESLATVHRLRQLPAPLRDDPAIDLREGRLMVSKDRDSAEKCYRSAAQKGIAQDKRQVYAMAEQSLCYLNPSHAQDPPECRAAYDIFSAAGNLALAGGTLQLMAEHQRLTGHPLQAIPLYEEAIRTLQDAGDYEGVGVALNNLSLIYETEGQWAKAEEAYKKARQNFASVNDRVNLGNVTANIADIEGARGNFQSADKLYRQSWEIDNAAKPALDQYPHIAHANLLLITGHLDEAAAEVRPQIASLHSSGLDPWQNANALTGLGDIQHQQGDLNAAQKSYEEATQLLKGANASANNQQVALAQLAIERGHAGEAERDLREVIASLEKDKNAGDAFGAYLALCKALLAERKIPEMIASLQRARSLMDVRPFPVFSMPLETLELRAKVADAPTGKAGRETLLVVQRDLRRLVQRAHQIGFYTAECEARIALGEVETQLSPAMANDHLAALSAEAVKRGFNLYADQAGRINSHSSEALALARPAG
ncbi:MAG TPA: winged helix-turn-helix domain-containing protein [Terracidiphilus sp.]|nr:winged helix-turn-helix domain-containing protein [Terracidiphilus sp.]